MPISPLDDISLGSSPGAGDGDPARTAFGKINDNNAALEAAILTQSDVDARVVAVGSGIQTWQFRAYDMTVVAGETTRTQITNSIATLDAVSFPSSAGFHWATLPFFLPARWNEGSFRFRVGWVTNNTNTGDVEFGLYAHTVSDGEVFPTSFASIGMSVTDAGSGTDKSNQITGWSSWNAMSSEPAKNALNLFRLQRNKSAAGDTYTGAADVYLVELQWINNALTDGAAP